MHRPPLPPRSIPGLISVRGWVDHRARVLPEGLCQRKNSNDTIGNRTHDLPTCSECLNQLRASRNKMQVLIIAFPPTWFGAFCAIFRENYFLHSQYYCYNLSLHRLATFIQLPLLFHRAFHIYLLICTNECTIFWLKYYTNISLLCKEHV